VKNSDDRVYFKARDDRKMYDENATIGAFGRGLSPREKRAQRDSDGQVGFDAKSEAHAPSSRESEVPLPSRDRHRA
jgi:hypothetical protein